MNKLVDQLNPYYNNEDLLNELIVLPEYKKVNSISERLMSLLDIYKIFIPSTSTFDIYNRLYMSVVCSLEKKNTIEEVKLINDNYRSEKKYKRYGIIGGLESFRITGNAGLGKTSSVQRCIDIITGNRIIKCDNYYREIIPILFIECVADELAPS